MVLMAPACVVRVPLKSIDFLSVSVQLVNCTTVDVLIYFRSLTN